MDSYFERLRLIKLGKLPAEAVPKKKKPIAKKSAKKLAKEAEERKLSSIEGQAQSLDEWFLERRKEMKGRCFFCGGKTERDNDETFKRSIHHLFEKRKGMFPSVALHPDNWLELCFWGNSCHTNIHNGTITWELLADSNEWGAILEKLKKVYPHISPAEHKNIPEFLLTQIK